MRVLERKLEKLTMKNSKDGHDGEMKWNEEFVVD